MGENKKIYAALIACWLSGCGERQSSQSGEAGLNERGGSVEGSSNFSFRRNTSEASDFGQSAAAKSITEEDLLELNDQDLIAFSKGWIFLTQENLAALFWSCRFPNKNYSYQDP